MTRLRRCQGSIAITLAAAAMAETSVLVKLFPRPNPVVNNALGMSLGAAALLTLTLVTGEPLALPSQPATWAALALPGRAGHDRAVRASSCSSSIAGRRRRPATRCCSRRWLPCWVRPSCSMSRSRRCSSSARRWSWWASTSARSRHRSRGPCRDLFRRPTAGHRRRTSGGRAAALPLGRHAAG